MGLKLNSCSDESILDDINDNIEFINEIYPSFNDDKKNIKIQYFAESYYELGAYYYQQEKEKDLIVECFRKSTEPYIKLFKSYSEETTKSRNIWSFFNISSPLIICFGNEEQKQYVYAMEEWRYRNIYHKKQNDLALIVKSILSLFKSGTCQETLILSNYESLIEKGRHSKEECIPLYKTLLGFVNKDKSMFSTGLASYLKRYENVSKKGEYRYLTPGLICLSGLMLVKLGLESGMEVDLNSKHLPIHLLNK